MSIGAQLVCVDCAEDLWLGNLGGEPIDPSDSSEYRAKIRIPCHRVTGPAYTESQMWDCVQRFLLMHRGHELRFVGEHATEHIEEYVDKSYFHPEDILEISVPLSVTNEADNLGPELRKRFMEKHGPPKKRSD